MIALVVAGVVALFGIACYLGIPSILSECEAERLELKDGHTGRWL